MTVTDNSGEVWNPCHRMTDRPTVAVVSESDCCRLKTPDAESLREIRTALSVISHASHELLAKLCSYRRLCKL